jgi:hypothetical protein
MYEVRRPLLFKSARLPAPYRTYRMLCNTNQADNFSLVSRWLVLQNCSRTDAEVSLLHSCPAGSDIITHPILHVPSDFGFH